MSVVRVQGVPLAPNKHVVIALRGIYGIGKTRALKICQQTGLAGETIVKSLGEEAVRQLQEAVGQYVTEGDLRREIAMRIKRLRDIGCYRGKRHRAGLPVRGQRTRTNARTRKGPVGRRK